MTKEAWEALGKEIAFVALGMRQKQFFITIRAGEITEEENKWIKEALTDSLGHPLSSDYWKGGNPE